MTFFADPHTWVLISFIVFVIAVARPFLSTVITQLDARQTLIANQIKEVAEIYKTAKELHAKKTARLNEVNKEARELLKKAEEDANEIRLGMERQLQETLQKKRSIYDHMIEAMERKGLVAMEQRVVERALQAIKLMLKNDISPALHDKVIERKTRQLKTYH